MAIRLLHREGPLQGHEQRFDRDRIRVGRKPDNDVVVDDKVVSSHHAEIRCSRGVYRLADLGSTNGTLLNGRRVEEEPLDDHDVIQLGDGGPVFEFRIGGREAADLPRIMPLTGSWDAGLEPIEFRAERLTIGRGQDNDIVAGRVPGSPVSTCHAEIRRRNGACEIEDLNSTNGTFVNGRRIRASRLHDGDRVELGTGGPVFELRLHQRSRGRGSKQVRESERILRKLERAARGGPAGEHTMLFLQAAQKYYKRRRWPLLVIIGIVLMAALGISFELYRKHRQVQELRALAESVFYKMRVSEAELVGRRDTLSQVQFEDLRNKRVRLEQDYDQYLERLGIYDDKTPIQQAVMRLARRLGETDLDIPQGFEQTVRVFVEKWRGTARLRAALDRARARGLPRKIRLALDQYGLPRDLLFIALQESGFDATQVGPPTRFGIAKGMWQFIPETAVEYGLTPGPLRDVAQYDPSDQRHDETRSTQAAARYLAFLYSTKAAASGLLVIASYNYGQTRIIEKLDQLPNDPQQRSFWNFYRNGWIPAETRDYVMYIFSAALICDKPHLFDFAMEPISSLW